jgi:hypothetical protein
MRLEIYKGYKIHKESFTTRLYVSGPYISILRFWYNINICKSYVDFIIKIFGE